MATGDKTLSTAGLVLALTATFTKELDLANLPFSLTLNRGKTFTNGEGANQANRVFVDTRSTDETGESLNIYDGGVLKDPHGDVLTCDKVKALYIRNNDAVKSLQIGGAGADDWPIFANVSDMIVIKPAGELLMIMPDSDGLDITSNDILKIKSATAGSISYDIIIIAVDPA